MAETPLYDFYETSIIPRIDGERETFDVLISNLSQRALYALIGPGGLEAVPMSDRHPITYAVEGMQGVTIQPESLVVAVTSLDAAERVTQWLARFTRTNSEMRARHEAALRVPRSRRPALPEAEVETVPAEPQDQITRTNLPSATWWALQNSQSRRHVESAEEMETIFGLSGVNRVEFPQEGVIVVGVSDAEAWKRATIWLEAFVAAREAV